MKFLFGAGKVNAQRAVERARALLGPLATPEPNPVSCPDNGLTVINEWAAGYDLFGRGGLPEAEIPYAGFKFQRGDQPPRFSPVNSLSVGFKLYK